MTDNRIIITITKKQITRAVAFGVVILAFIIIALFVKFKIEDANIILCILIIRFHLMKKFL